MPPKTSEKGIKKHKKVVKKDGSKKPQQGKQRGPHKPRDVRAPFRRGRTMNPTAKAQIQHIENDINKAQNEGYLSQKLLLTTDPGFIETGSEKRTVQLRQSDIYKEVDLQNQRKLFDITLDKLGPYSIDFTRNGRHVLIGGKKGHVGLFDFMNFKLLTERQFQQTIRDVKFLHNETLFAVAQKSVVYIYDNQGVEVHRLHSHAEPTRLEYLPYHWLLASVGNRGFLCYQDLSTGQIVYKKRTQLGPCNVMTQNRTNAIIALGHQNGTVTMWSPANEELLVKKLCHSCPILSAAIDFSGNYLVTSGVDQKVKIHDLRMNYQEVHYYTTKFPPHCLAVSQRGMLAAGGNEVVRVWEDLSVNQGGAYLNHQVRLSTVNDIAFCPYDDVVGIGHSRGFSTMLVPGSGEPNFDTYEDNPFITKSQRREQEVHKLLDKIPAEMISLDNDFVGKAFADKAEKQESNKIEVEGEKQASLEFKPVIEKSDEEEEEEEEEEGGEGGTKKKKEKNKMRGKNKIGKKLSAKQNTYFNQQREKHRDSLIKKAEEEEEEDDDDALPSHFSSSRPSLDTLSSSASESRALARFFKN